MVSTLGWAAMHDDLGFDVARSGPVGRVVSLVPSLTEAIAVTRPESLVGATDWCTHPAGLAVPRVRGTKNPDRAAIVDLSPDLVVANKEENRELDVRRLREAGVPVWVTDIETVEGAFTSMRRLFGDAFGWGVPAWLEEAERLWAEPAAAGGPRVAVAIWRDPWMVVGRDTFTGDLLSRLGLVHAFAGHTERYPHVDLADLDTVALDLVLLPDEPYVFTEQDGPEAFARVPTALCSGRALTWYGPSLLTARQQLAAALA
jgi:ABC-type Fe3+-hydroxamate transport system substrate-binding protein